TAIELSELLRTWSAEFIPLPAHLRVPWGSGLKSALLNSTAVGAGRGAFNKNGLLYPSLSSCGDPVGRRGRTATPASRWWYPAPRHPSGGQSARPDVGLRHIPASGSEPLATSPS